MKNNGNFLLTGWKLSSKVEIESKYLCFQVNCMIKTTMCCEWVTITGQWQALPKPTNDGWNDRLAEATHHDIWLGKVTVIGKLAWLAGEIAGCVRYTDVAAVLRTEVDHLCGELEHEAVHLVTLLAGLVRVRAGVVDVRLAQLLQISQVEADLFLVHDQTSDRATPLPMSRDADMPTGPRTTGHFLTSRGDWKTRIQSARIVDATTTAVRTCNIYIIVLALRTPRYHVARTRDHCPTETSLITSARGVANRTTTGTSHGKPHRFETAVVSTVRPWIAATRRRTVDKNWKNNRQILILASPPLLKIEWGGGGEGQYWLVKKFKWKS